MSDNVNLNPETLEKIEAIAKSLEKMELSPEYALATQTLECTAR